MLRVLIPAEIREDSATAMCAFELSRNIPNYTHQLQQDRCVTRFGGNQRGNMCFRDHHNVNGIGRSCVVVREDIRGLRNDIHLGVARENFAAIEVVLEIWIRMFRWPSGIAAAIFEVLGQTKTLRSECRLYDVDSVGGHDIPHM